MDVRLSGAPGDFRSMGRTARSVFACRPAMRRHMQQLQQHYLELWTRRLSTPRAGREPHLLAGNLPWHGRRGPGAPLPDRARAAPEGCGDGPVAPTTGSGRHSGIVPPVPHPREASV